MREHLMAFEDLIRQLRVAGAKLQSNVDMVISLNHVKQRLLVEEKKQQERYLNFFRKGTHGVFWRKSKVPVVEVRRTEPQVWRERLHEKGLRRRVQFGMRSGHGNASSKLTFRLHSARVTI